LYFIPSLVSFKFFISNTGWRSPNETIIQLANAAAISVAFPNQTGNLEVFKGGATFAIDVSASKADLKVRVIKGNDDDYFFNQKVSDILTKKATAKAMIATVIGNFGDGSGMVRKMTATLTFGFVNKRADFVNNVNGDTEQAISEYTINFGYSTLTAN